MSGEKGDDNFPIPSPDLEQDPGHALLGAQAAEGLDPRCSIHVHSIRRRLADPDGISAKAAIDGIVHAGLLPDDSPQHVRAVTYSQEKGAEEQTIITIAWEWENES